MHYQPIVDIRSERVCGYEALTRWRHRERGLLPPSEFIGIAEEVGFIIPLGEWVLRKACNDAADWSPYLRLAVNISPAQCTQALTQTVFNALAASRLTPDRLELEITESALLQDNSATLATLHRLRKLGVKHRHGRFRHRLFLAVLFAQLPLRQDQDRQELRQRRAGPSREPVDRPRRGGLGLSFGVPTTAEGVETREQFEQIKAAGCTQCQGYLFGRAIPNGEVMRALQQRRQAIRKPGYA